MGARRYMGGPAENLGFPAHQAAGVTCLQTLWFLRASLYNMNTIYLVQYVVGLESRDHMTHRGPLSLTVSCQATLEQQALMFQQ